MDVPLAARRAEEFVPKLCFAATKVGEEFIRADGSTQWERHFGESTVLRMPSLKVLGAGLGTPRCLPCLHTKGCVAHLVGWHCSVPRHLGQWPRWKACQRGFMDL